jgi:hypothetical protein
MPIVRRRCRLSLFRSLDIRFHSLHTRGAIAFATNLKRSNGHRKSSGIPELHLRGSLWTAIEFFS